MPRKKQEKEPDLLRLAHEPVKIEMQETNAAPLKIMYAVAHNSEQEAIDFLLWCKEKDWSLYGYAEVVDTSSEGVRYRTRVCTELPGMENAFGTQIKSAVIAAFFKDDTWIKNDNIKRLNRKAAKKNG